MDNRGLVRLEAGPAIAEIAARGAELRRWTIGGRDLLWRPNPAVWDATAPILFPVVGWTRGGVIRVRGRTYPLGVHGFAASRPFAVAAQAPDAVTVIDRSDAETRSRYPFEYELAIEFRLGREELSCSSTVTNAGPDALPYALGLHPGFRWPEGGGRIVFDREERSDVPVIAEGGLFSERRRPIPLAGNVLELSRAQMAREALCFLDLRSNGLWYEAPGFGRLRADFENFPHVALWSRPPAPFLCIEAWTGYGDPENFSGDLHEKPSIRLLAPGASARYAVRWRFEV